MENCKYCSGLVTILDRNLAKCTYCGHLFAVRGDKLEEPDLESNSIMDIESIRDFFNAQVYGKVYHYIRENHIPLDTDNEVVHLALEILRKADSLPSIYLHEFCTCLYY